MFPVDKYNNSHHRKFNLSEISYRNSLQMLKNHIRFHPKMLKKYKLSSENC